MNGQLEQLGPEAALHAKAWGLGWLPSYTLGPQRCVTCVGALQAVVAEEQRLRGCLAVGCGPSKAQQQLAQQHSELQKELWDVAEQLEAKVSQLTALKQAGLL